MSELIICKHNELIENFIFNATESELQVLNYAVAVTNPKWENKNLIYKITIPELVAVYKTKAKSAYSDYRQALSRLMKRTYTFYDEQGIKQTENLVVRIGEDPKDTSYLIFKFNEYVSTRISGLRGFFTQYDIKHIAMFRSKYAFTLYEFFKMRIEQAKHHNSENYKHKIPILDFKKNLAIDGKYKVFAELERNVLQPAQKNINTHSDINMSYKVIRKARTPTHIVFTAKYKKSKETKKVAPQEEPAQVNVLQNVAQKNYIEESKPASDDQRASGKQRLAEIRSKISQAS